MAVSQNGWQANDRSLITTISVPGGTLPVREGDVAVVFEWLARRFNDEVEPLKWPGCWGYAERVIRGGVSLSNHASGTAVDFNAPAHPLGKVGTFTKAQVKAIRRILDDAHGVIRWGGDYKGRKDEMHFEVNASAKAVAALARQIREDDMPLTAAEKNEVADLVVSKLLRARLKNSHNNVEASTAAWWVYGNEKAGDARDNSAAAVKAIDDLRAALNDTVAKAATDAVKAAIADGTLSIAITVNGAPQ